MMDDATSTRLFFDCLFIVRLILIHRMLHALLAMVTRFKLLGLVPYKRFSYSEVGTVEILA